MSNYWDLHCRTCGADCGFHWNHGDHQLLAIWQHRAAFVELGKLAGVVTEIDNTLPSGVHVEFEIKFYGPESGGYGFAEFASAHHDHDVVAKSEYGYFSDDCQEYVDHPTNKNVSLGRCRFKAGHDGDHVPEER